MSSASAFSATLSTKIAKIKSMITKIGQQLFNSNDTNSLNRFVRIQTATKKKQGSVLEHICGVCNRKSSRRSVYKV